MTKKAKSSIKKILHHLHEAVKELQELDKITAAIAQAGVHSLGKGEVVSSNLTRSSKLCEDRSIENWVGPSIKDPIIDGVSLSDLRARANKSCRCDGGNNNCSACVAERMLSWHGYTT